MPRLIPRRPSGYRRCPAEKGCSSETLFRSLPHARAVLGVWRRLQPRSYASTLSGGGSAGTLRFSGASRPGLLPPGKQKVQIDPELSSPLDKKTEVTSE